MPAKKNKTIFKCSSCSHEETKWLGRCPSCGSWNSFEEEQVTVKKKTTSAEKKKSAEAINLTEVDTLADYRFTSGITELDRVLGGGIMKGGAVLLGGEPGIGKSTLMLQLLSSSPVAKCLYISGEESPTQIRMRADRLKLKLNKIFLLHDAELEHIERVLNKNKPQLVIVDSVQTLFSQEVGLVPGTTSQIKYSCMELINWAKLQGTAIFFIGHVTKDGSLAGPKVIEHMVDTVINFEQAASGIRIIRASKNRFGSVDELGVFTMGGKGLLPVADPATFFIGQRREPIPSGSVISAVFEGSRTFMVEIQALTIPAKSGYSRVYSDRIDSARVSRISAVLEKHFGLSLSANDIYINVAGGMRLSEVGIELALAMAIYTSITGKKLSNNIVLVGELSLAGELRTVQHLDKRIKTAREMGFTVMVGPDIGTKSKVIHKNHDGLTFVPCRTIEDAVLALTQ